MSFTPRGYERFSTFSPEQLSLFQSLIPRLQEMLSGEDLDKFAAPYRREFEERTIPGLAERFSGLGAGSQSSSAFQQALGASGADLSERLASLGTQREQLGLRNALSLLDVSSQGLVPKQSSFLKQLLLGLSGGGGQFLGKLGGTLLGGIL